MLAAAVFAVGACAGEDTDAGYDSGAAVSQTAGGDVAGSSTSLAMAAAFLTTVNQGEVEAGQLAQDKATNAQVKQYAQLMVTDHRQAQDQLQGHATADSTAAGQATADLHAKHQQVMQALQSTAKGRAFDSTYVAAMVTGHEDVLQRLQTLRSGAGTASQAGTMQSHVESSVQMVQRHLDRAREIQRSLGGTR
jgi:putative membrane protein